MSLNPIVALSEQLQKLINEHGSAAILRDHLAMFKDQVSLLEKENARLVIENEDLMAKVQVFQSEKDVSKTVKDQLVKDNEDLMTKIQEYEQPVGNKRLIEEIKERILFWLSKNSAPSEQLANTLQINFEVAKFHLQELKDLDMIQEKRERIHNSFRTVWCVAQEGRRHLIENKIIS